MIALVTGAAGFIGSHLCERLIHDGHTVIAVDDLSTGNLDNLSSVASSPRLRFCKYDVNYMAIHGEVDWVFHLAAKADVVPSIENPLEYHHSNVSGTIHTLELSRKLKAKRFIYAASSSCYGIPEFYPTPEFAKINPRYPYALTKYLGEQYVLHWANVFGLSCLSLRLFNVFGPRARTSGAYGAVFGTFLSQLANGAPVTIVGDGEQARDFTYVTDVVDAFVRAAESTFSGEVINVGTGRAHSVNYLASLLGAIDRVYLPDRPGEPRKTQADNFRSEAWLGWTAKTSFENGVDLMKRRIDDFKNAPLWTVEKIEEATKNWFYYLGDKCESQS